jgi:hypothetical protein
MLVFYHSRQFAMCHGSYNSNLGSEIMILVGDFRSRSWPNIGGTYGTQTKIMQNKNCLNYELTLDHTKSMYSCRTQ